MTDRSLYFIRYYSLLFVVNGKKNRRCLLYRMKILKKCSDQLDCSEQNENLEKMFRPT